MKGDSYIVYVGLNTQTYTPPPPLRPFIGDDKNWVHLPRPPPSHLYTAHFFMTRGHHSAVGSHSQYIQREEGKVNFIAYPLRNVEGRFDGVRNEGLTYL